MEKLLTPPSLPTTTQCRPLTIPQSKEWLGVFNALLLAGIYEYNWQQVNETDLTPQQCAAVLYDIFETYSAGACSSPELTVPFWDDPEGDNADTGEDNPAFPFYEDAAAFVIGGFVLYAAGPGAALEYWTVQKQFRLALRKHDLGGILKIFLDGTLLGEVNTYSATPELTYFDVISTGSTLRLEVAFDSHPSVPAGAQVVQIIRKRLWQGELLPDNVRYNETTDTVEQYDVLSDQWVDAPFYDPRLNNHHPPPIGANIRCTAAARMRYLLEDMISNLITMIGAGAGVLEIAQFIAGILLEIGFITSVLVIVILEVASSLLELGGAVLFAEFEGMDWNAFQCALVGYLSSNGYITADNFHLFDVQRVEQYTLVQRETLRLMFQVTGFAGLNDAAATRTETYDCSACENSLYYDFRLSPYDFRWQGWSGNFNYTERTTWVAGQGWKASRPGTNMGMGIAAFRVPMNTIGYDRYRISIYCPVNSVWQLVIRNSDTQALLFNSYWANSGIGNIQVSPNGVAFDADYVDIYFGYGGNTTNPAYLRSLEIYGSLITPHPYS